jgi:hypothetical protein
MDRDATPSERLDFDLRLLMAEHPPVLRNENKRIVFGIACPPGCLHEGRLTYSRWEPLPLPAHVSPAAAMERAESREGVYDYAPSLPGSVEWHVNFADPDLFFGYVSGLFAQDEIQVAEHPSLGALREALIAGGSAPRTDENDRPTPVLVMGAPRRCRVTTDPDLEQPRGLYGNAFAAASPEAVRRATTRIDPPTVSNLIAIAAPTGCGRYTVRQIERVLTTACTGFRAAVLQSGGSSTVVHTGFWGCGAFGGNRELMAMLQVLAAGMAEVDRLVFHTVRHPGNDVFARALERIGAIFPEKSIERRILANRIAAMNFEWGISDGN